MAKKIRLEDLPSGHDGKAYLEVDDRTVAAFMASKVSPKVSPVTENQQFLGERVEQNAVRGLKISGDLEYYHSSMELIRAARDYKDGEPFPDITLRYYVESPAYGRCEIVLFGVIPADIPFGGLDDSSAKAIRVSTSFTANDYDIISNFKE